MSSKINLQTCEYARKSSIFQDNQLISKKYKKPFNFLRCGADAVFITCSLLLVAVFSLDFTMLREGTWISMLVLGNTMAVSFPLMQKCSICYRRKNEKKEVSL
ncbi:hypothetical protein MKD03_08325 [[Clostridium] innocuum]|nr:hypothetical protein [[Clostridium] innocuum]